MTLMLPRALAARFAVLLAALAFAAAAVAQSDDLTEAQKLLRAGQLAPALERVDSALRANPKSDRARFLKGVILTEQNKPAEAIRIFTALTEDFPEYPEPYNNLAVLYAQQGQYDRARSVLEMAIRTDPRYATAHENLGDIYAKLASQAYDKALQLDKANAGAQTKLGLIKELLSSAPAKGVKPAPARSDAAARPLAASAPAKPAVAAPEPVRAAEPAAKAAEPAKAQPAAAAGAPQATEVLKAVNAWAQAWSNNDVGAYLGYYAADFRTPNGEPRSDWEASRKARIAKPKKIDVKVEAPKVTFTDANRVSVTFRQNYNSPNLKVSNMKTLLLVRSGNRWLIQQEIVGS